MTISIKVSVNGNYKVPVTVTRSGRDAVTEVISGRGLPAPFVKDINYEHGTGDVVTVSVGPEEQDNGEVGAASA